jgi:hypothetical protein
MLAGPCERLPFDRLPALGRDPDTLNVDRQASQHGLGLSHDRRESRQHKAAERFDREAVRYDEHFLADTARSVGQHFQGAALFATETHRHQISCEVDRGHVQSSRIENKADQAFRGSKAGDMILRECCNWDTYG